MGIAGFETRALVEAQIAALEREQRSHTWSERHREEIAGQLQQFRLALKELEATGDPVEEKRRGSPTTVRNSTTGETFTEYVA